MEKCRDRLQSVSTKIRNERRPAFITKNISKKYKNKKNQNMGKIDLKKFINFGNNENIKLSNNLKISFLEQLGNLLSAGFPLVNSLKIILYQTKNKKVKQVVEKTLDNLTRGGTFKESLEKFPRTFSNFDIAMIKMGELTGQLSEAIDKIKEKEEKTKEIRGKVIGALVYPMIVTVLAIGMIAVFLLFVIPRIEKMYSDSKVNLPGITQTIIDISNFLQKNYQVVGIAILAFVGLFILFKKHPKTKIYYDNAIIRIPIFGRLVKNQSLALFAFSVGTLLSNGVIINEALQVAKDSSESDVYKRESKRLQMGVSKGTSLSVLMGIDLLQSGKENFYFPIEMASVVKIGEETGTLDSLLLKYSIKINKEIDQVVKAIALAIEPLVIVIVGSIIGTLIIAILLPFFNMVNVI